MKYVIGTIVTLVILSVAAYFLADLWGYDTLISPEQLKKSAVTLAVLGVVFILLLILVPFFFKDHAKAYDKDQDGVVQPKKSVKN